MRCFSLVPAQRRLAEIASTWSEPRRTRVQTGALSDPGVRVLWKDCRRACDDATFAAFCLALVPRLAHFFAYTVCAAVRVVIRGLVDLRLQVGGASMFQMMDPMSNGGLDMIITHIMDNETAYALLRLTPSFSGFGFVLHVCGMSRSVLVA